MSKFGEWEELINIFIKKNSEINLSAIRNPQDIYTKHILDSLMLNKFFDISGKKIVDIGTGSGFPVMPLAITNPTSNFIGIESIKKKVDAVNEISNSLSIKNLKVIWTRAEEHNEKYDILIARAVGYFDKLLVYGLHLIKSGGLMILFKMYSEEEKKDIDKLCKINKLELKNIFEYKLFEDDIKRIIYIIEKK